MALEGVRLTKEQLGTRVFNILVRSGFTERDSSGRFVNAGALAEATDAELIQASHWYQVNYNRWTLALGEKSVEKIRGVLNSLQEQS